MVANIFQMDFSYDSSSQVKYMRNIFCMFLQLFKANSEFQYQMCSQEEHTWVHLNVFSINGITIKQNQLFQKSIPASRFQFYTILMYKIVYL